MNKSIIFLNSSHDIYGGGQIYVQEIRDELKKRNIPCDIYSSDKLTDNSILIPKIDSWLYKIKNLKKVIKILPKNKEIVLITNDITISMCSVFFKIYGYKVIPLIHMSLINTASKNKIIKLIYPKVRAKLISLGAGKVLNVNKENDKILKSIYIGNFINLGFYNNRDNRDIDFIFVGRLSVEKNPVAFVHIIRDVFKVNKNIKAVIVGDGDLRCEVEREIKKYHLENNIKMVGFLKRNDIYEFYRRSHNLLITSKTEGLPTVLLEGAAFGVNFISTKVGSVPWLVDKYKIGHVVELSEMSDFIINNNNIVDPDKLKKLVLDHNVGIFCDRFLKYINE